MQPDAFRRLPPDFGGRRITGMGFDKDALLQSGIEEAYAGEDVAQAATVTQSIAKDIVGVNDATAEIAMGTDQVNSSAEELSRLAEQLEKLVGNFRV